MSSLIGNNETALLRQVASGDETAFALLVERYGRRVFTHLVSFVKSYEVAEEMAQDVFVSIWDTRERLSGVNSFPDYLFIICRNRLISYLRRKMPAHIPLEAGDLTGEFIQEQPLELKELEQMVRSAVDKLKPRQREIFLLSREAGLSYREIAEQLGLSHETVKWHLSEALKQLRLSISESGNELLLAWFLFVLIPS